MITENITLSDEMRDDMFKYALEVINIGNTIQVYKTKYFVLHWFDEVCSENNEVNEEAESKRQLKDSQKTAERQKRDC